MKVSPVLPGPEVCRMSSISAEVVLGSEVKTALKAVEYMVMPQIRLYGVRGYVTNVTRG